MEKLGINVFDVAALAVAVFGSWIGAGWIALNYSQLVEPEVLKLVQSAELARFGSMLVVFVGALIALVMVTNTLSKAIRLSPLNKPDRILGAGFGVICAWAAMGLAFLFFKYLGPKPLPPVVEGGATFPLVRDMADSIEPHLPPGVRTRLTEKPDINLDPGQIPLPEMPKMPEAPKPPQ